MERFPLLLQCSSSIVFQAQCEFSLCITKEIEPFLKLFQCEKPMAVFLFAEVKTIITSPLEHIVKPEVLEKNFRVSKLMRLDLSMEENLLPISSINIGFRAEALLKTLETTEKTEEH